MNNNKSNIKNNHRFTALVCLIWFMLWSQALSSAMAGLKFESKYKCLDDTKVCTSPGGVRKIDGFEVHRDCWEYSYIKNCDYPSQNDCMNYKHCYFIRSLRCLLTDAGNCVNLEKEFSCKSWVPVIKENKTMRLDLKEKEGGENLVCTGIPCLDGNCVDKSYKTNGEMMDSISKLYAVSKMAPDRAGNFNLFEGSNQHCSKKMADYSNCCRTSDHGWGTNLGAECTKDEEDLMHKRSRNLCVYVGKESIKTAGVVTGSKHYFCCWSNMLDKVVQVEGRKQLGLSFGSGGAPDCRGLTIEEIQRLDFNNIDFSEFINELQTGFAATYRPPSPEKIANKISGFKDNLRKKDDNQDNPANNMTGWKGNLGDDLLEEAEEPVNAN